MVGVSVLVGVGVSVLGLGVDEAPEGGVGTLPILDIRNFSTHPL